MTQPRSYSCYVALLKFQLRHLGSKFHILDHRDWSDIKLHEGLDTHEHVNGKLKVSAVMVSVYVLGSLIPVLIFHKVSHMEMISTSKIITVKVIIVKVVALNN